MEEGIKLRVITPDALFYEGVASSIIVKTVDGYMGFLRGRAPACVLLAEDGKLRFREIVGADGEKTVLPFKKEEKESPSAKKEEDDFLEAHIEGGFAYMKGGMTIYTDLARWEGLDEDGSAGQSPTQEKKEKLRPDTQPKE